MRPDQSDERSGALREAALVTQTVERRSIQPLVSVIVPVYNAEPFLGECLASLSSQSLGELEIIAVDDASSDRSREIVVSYQRDRRIRLIQQPRNRGVSAARNRGIEAATGTYIAFVDADDHVGPRMFETMYRTGDRLGADIVSCGHSLCGADGTVLSSFPFPLPPNVLMDHEAMVEALHSAWQTRILWFPVRNLYRRRLIMGSGLRFDESIRFGEDSLFNLQAFFAAERSVAVDEAFYNYRRNPGSVTATKGPLLAESASKLFAEVRDFYVEAGFDSRAFGDQNRYVLGVDLPTLLSNAIRFPSRRGTRHDLAGILDLPMIQEVLRSDEAARGGFPAKVQLLVALSRRRQVRAMDLLLRTSRALKRKQ